MMNQLIKCPVYIIALLTLSLVISCSDTNLEQDHVIQPHEYFDIKSKYANGWIKEATLLHFDKSTASNFKYFPNGGLESIDVYETPPNHHLSMIVSCNEDLTIASSSFFIETGKYSEFFYDHDQLGSKTVYHPGGKTTFSYSEGDIKAIQEYLENGDVRVITYQDNTRDVSYLSDGQMVFSEETSLISMPGMGISRYNEIPLLNRFGEESIAVESIGTTSTASLTGDSFRVHPNLPVWNLYEDYKRNSDVIDVKRCLNDDAFRSITENFSHQEAIFNTEQSVYYHERKILKPSSEIKNQIHQELQEDSTLFALKYGDHYLSEITTGRWFYLVQVIRNMPTKTESQLLIQNIALKRYEEITDGKEYVNLEEQQTLEKVHQQFHFYSSLPKHQKGIIIRNHEEYEQALKELNEAEVTIIQKQYKPYNQL
ncbi:hypothetical protein [Marinoscillum sp.]|uniref:hypothetical protein n=1 Tax=Marinoscillum sp. TaxID=2024838 RepID=UPI003BACCD82